MNEKNQTTVDDVQRLADAQAAIRTVREQLARVIVGQDETVEQLLVALLARGHCLLVGVPGLAKTLMIRSLAEVLDLSFRRIQFTPDLMPTDITGTEVIEQDPASGKREMRFLRGPVFANIVLADEINRTPPKTQAALLEAMQEQQVTVAGQRLPLDPPFFVLATQNPIEQEGTYPLPEAQLDRFMLDVRVDYPAEAEELAIVRQTTVDQATELQTILTAEQIIEIQHLVRRIPVTDDVILYAIRLARRTRPDEETSPDWIRRFVRWGAGPRAGQCLILAAKAQAALQGRTCVLTEDVRRVALPVLRHRVLPNFAAEAEGIDADKLIERLLETVEVPDGGDVTKGGRLPDLLSD